MGSALGQAKASALAVAEGMSKDCQQSTATPDRTNDHRIGMAKMQIYHVIVICIHAP